jgi:hypothetical protein
MMFCYNEKLIHQGRERVLNSSIAWAPFLLVEVEREREREVHVMSYCADTQPPPNNFFVLLYFFLLYSFYIPMSLSMCLCRFLRQYSPPSPRWRLTVPPTLPALSVVAPLYVCYCCTLYQKYNTMLISMHRTLP